jgi:hypothetical protein
MKIQALTPDRRKYLKNRGWHAFPELNDSDNDTILRARINGFAICFPASDTQAANTLRFAKEFLEEKKSR